MVEEVERFLCSRRSSPRWETDSHGSVILLSGPSSSGKSSLLFQYAFNSVSEKEAGIEEEEEEESDHKGIINYVTSRRRPQVLFICIRSRLHSKPPYLSQEVNPSSHLFQLIQMKYVEDIEQLNNYFAAFHLHDEFPVTVVIDDFGLLFDDSLSCNNHRGRDLLLVKSLALCCNAINHANETGHPCKLLLSDTHRGDFPRFLYIYRRWVSSIYSIKGDGFGSFLLQRSPSSNLELQEELKIAKYSIAHQHLVFQGFLQDTI